MSTYWLTRELVRPQPEIHPQPRNDTYITYSYTDSHYRTSFCLDNATTEEDAHKTNTPIKIQRLDVTDAGESNSSCSKSAAVYVPLSRAQLNPWNEYLIGEIHCNQTTQFCMKGNGTKPPLTARNTTVHAAPTKKVRSWENMRIDVNYRVEIRA